MQKNNLFLFGTFIFLISCQNFQLKSREQFKEKIKSANPLKSESIENKKLTEIEVNSQSTQVDQETNYNNDQHEVNQNIENSPQVNLPPLPKIAIILGPGGARTFAHIGVIKELHRRRAPLVAVSGIEMGALFASLYAWHGQMNDLDWQLNKVKNEFFLKKNILGQSEKSQNPNELQSFLNQVFGIQKIEDFKYQFACPAIQLQGQESYVMSKGSAVNSLNYCLYSPPLFNANNGYTSGLFQIKQLANFLRSRGASYVVFVNVLPAKGMSIRTNNQVEQIYWTQVNQLIYDKSNIGVDEVLQLNVGNYSLTDIEQRDDIYRLSEKSAQQLVNQLLKKWSL